MDSGAATFVIMEEDACKTLALYVDEFRLFDRLENKASGYLAALLLAVHYVFNIEYQPSSLQPFYKQLEKLVFNLK